MLLERSAWRGWLDVKNPPHWICPTCNKGYIIFKENLVNIKASYATNEAYQEGFYEPVSFSELFSGILICSNDKCKEVVTIIGETSHDFNIVYHNSNEPPEQILIPIFKPKCIFPPLHIFHLSKKIPKDIKKVIIESFGLYWVDMSSCANKIRTVLEFILNDQNVKKISRHNNKITVLKLHPRLLEFEKTKSEIAKAFMAIKWIGNYGSHTGELTQDDLLDGLDILKYCLAKLYDDHSEHITKLTTTINKRKKPLGKKRKK